MRQTQRCVYVFSSIGAAEIKIERLSRLCILGSQAVEKLREDLRREEAELEEEEEKRQANTKSVPSPGYGSH